MLEDSWVAFTDQLGVLVFIQPVEALLELTSTLPEEVEISTGPPFMAW